MTKNEESNGPNFAGSLMNQTGKEFFLYIKKTGNNWQSRGKLGLGPMGGARHEVIVVDSNTPLCLPGSGQLRSLLKCLQRVCKLARVAS